MLNLVWGYEYPGDVRTVDVHIRRLREKIETVPSDPKYVHTKWGIGYYFQARDIEAGSCHGKLLMQICCGAPIFFWLPGKELEPASRE